MGERKGVNKYYPPDFDYKKHGSLDRYHNSHPLRERARKLKSEGILIIRFEMPYNIWCNGCNSHIGMGVRYNAEKKKVGNYYSTIIYKFRMKCHLCEQHFEIQTDPANCEYVILSGARRKEERWNAKDNEQIEMTDHAVKKQLATDPMYKLEHGAKDKVKLERVVPTLGEIQDLQEAKRDDYLLNKALRKKFRNEKKVIAQSSEKDQQLLIKSSLDIALVKEKDEDVRLSKLIKYDNISDLKRSQDEIRERIINEPIFSLTPPTGKHKHYSTTHSTGGQASQVDANKLGIKVKRRRTASGSYDSTNSNEPSSNDTVKSTELLKKSDDAEHESHSMSLASADNQPNTTLGDGIATCGNSLVAYYSSDEET